MAGYVKMWTTVKDDRAFISLSALQRSGFCQAIIDAKRQRDNGTVWYRNLTAMGQEWGCDGRTANKIATSLQSICNWTFTKHPDGTVELTIRNYKHWQEISAKEMSSVYRNSVANLRPPIPEQTKAEQSRPKQYDPHEDYLEFIKKEEHRIRDFLSKIEFRVIGSVDNLWDREVIGKICPWIRDDKERAAHSITTKHAQSWMHFIETWMRGAMKKYRDELDKTRGLSLKEETEHFRQKELNRGTGGEFTSIGNILNKAKGKV